MGELIDPSIVAARAAERQDDECELTLITVTYQSAAKIGPFLDAARSAAPDAELIVADNASSDETGSLVQEVAPRAQFLSADRNMGFGRSVNRAAARAGGRWLVVANPDVRLGKVTIPALEDETRFGLGAALVAEEGERPRSTLRAEATSGEDWADNVLSRFAPQPISRMLTPRRMHPPGWVGGALFLTPRRDFLDAGGFDPRFFMYFEDRDLGRRYRQSGLAIRSTAGLVGEHLAASSSAGVFRAEREAWALLSWLEYVAIWRGRPVAAKTARRAITVFTAAARVGDRKHAPQRVIRKAAEVRQMLAHVRDFVTRGDADVSGYYPNARAALGETQLLA